MSPTKLYVPEGRVCAVQVAPLLVVPMIVGAPSCTSAPRYPTASHVVVEAQTMSEYDPEEDGNVWAVQVDPPSVVPMMPA